MSVPRWTIGLCLTLLCFGGAIGLNGLRSATYSPIASPLIAWGTFQRQPNHTITTVDQPPSVVSSRQPTRLPSSQRVTETTLTVPVAIHSASGKLTPHPHAKIAISENTLTLNPALLWQANNRSAPTPIALELQLEKTQPSKLEAQP